MEAPAIIEVKTPLVQQLMIVNLKLGVAGEFMGRIFEALDAKDPFVKKCVAVVAAIFAATFLMMGPLKLLFHVVTGLSYLAFGGTCGLVALSMQAQAHQWKEVEKYSKKESFRDDVEGVLKEKIPGFSASTTSGWTIGEGSRLKEINIKQLKIPSDRLSQPLIEEKIEILKALNRHSIAAVKGTDTFIDRPDLLIRYEERSLYKISCIFTTLYVAGAKKEKYAYLRQEKDYFFDSVEDFTTHEVERLFFTGENQFYSTLFASFVAGEMVEVPGTSHFVRIATPEV